MKYGPDETTERALLASLRFVGRKQAAYVLDRDNPIEKVRSELHRVFPRQMAQLDAQINARPEPQRPTTLQDIGDGITAVAAQLAAVTGELAQRRAEQAEQDRLDAEFGIGAPTTGSTFAEPSNVQTFGAAPRTTFSKTLTAAERAALEGC